MLRTLNFSRRAIRHIEGLYTAGKPVFYSSTPANCNKRITLHALPREVVSKPNLHKRTISTLDATKLRSSDYIVLKPYQQPSFRIFGQGACRIKYDFAGPEGCATAFPPEASGFLYYEVGHHSSGITGEVRFRTTSTNDPTSFELGRDLQLPDGSPWKISLFSIASKSKFEGVRRSLLQSSLVTHELLTKCARIVQNSPGFHPYSSVILPSVDTPFKVNLAEKCSRLWVVDHTNAIANRFLLSDTGADLRVLSQTLFPYRGSLMLRFERSTMPQHAQTRTVFLRIAKVLEPIACVVPDYDGHLPFPREGRLIVKGGNPVWRNADKPANAALRQLFESE